MLALPISLPRFKVLFFYQNNPQIKLFLQKNAKFLSAWGSALVPLVAGGFAPRSPLVSISWGVPPTEPPNSPLITNFWLRA